MRNSCAVCSLAVALCLVVCVSANAEVTAESAARAAVEQAKQSVTDVCARAQSELNKANRFLEKVESSKREAAEAALKSQEAPQDNRDAVAIANTIKSLSGEVNKLYATEKQKLEEAVNGLNTLLSDAQTLEGKTDIKIEPDTSSSEDYTRTNGEAASLKEQATALNLRITTAVQPIAGVDTTVNDMEQKAKEAQLKDAHVSAIVAVAKIESMLGNSDNIIRQIDQKKNEVNGIVVEMKTLKPNPTTVSVENFNALQQSAAEALNAATGALENAKSAKADIQTQKGIADAALTKLKEEKQEVSDAQGEVQKAEACVSAAELIVPQLQNALKTADDSLTSATDSKHQLKTALSKATSKQSSEQSSTLSQVKALQDSVTSAVEAIRSVVEEAESTRQETENQKEKVNDIVQEIKKLSTTEFIEANQNIKVLYSKADDALTDATGALKNAEQAKTDMTEQKRLADAALSNVATAKDVNTAQEEVNTANECVNQVNRFAAILKSALQTAKTSVTNANDLKQKLETALSTTTTAPSTEKVKETEKAHLSVGNGTELDRKDTTIQPTITNTEQPTSKDSLGQSDNSADKLKDTLINGAQNVLTTALTGGKAPAPGANNDSAMTVFVPVLVALIASAVLQ